MHTRIRNQFLALQYAAFRGRAYTINHSFQQGNVVGQLFWAVFWNSYTQISTREANLTILKNGHQFKWSFNIHTIFKTG